MGQAILTLTLPHLEMMLRGEALIRVSGSPRDLRILSGHVRPEFGDMALVLESPDLPEVRPGDARLHIAAIPREQRAYRLDIGMLE